MSFRELGINDTLISQLDKDRLMIYIGKKYVLKVYNKKDNVWINDIMFSKVNNNISYTVKTHIKENKLYDKLVCIPECIGFYIKSKWIFNKHISQQTIEDAFISNTNDTTSNVSNVCILMYNYGNSLATYIVKPITPSFTLEYILMIVIDLCISIHINHSIRLYHRDINPSNIVMNKHYITLIDNSHSILFRDDYITTKQNYSIPDQFYNPIYENKSYLDKSDMWCLGLNILQIVTRRLMPYNLFLFKYINHPYKEEYKFANSIDDIDSMWKQKRNVYSKIINYMEEYVSQELWYENIKKIIKENIICSINDYPFLEKIILNLLSYSPKSRYSAKELCQICVDYLKKHIVSINEYLSSAEHLLNSLELEQKIKENVVYLDSFDKIDPELLPNCKQYINSICEQLKNDITYTMCIDLPNDDSSTMDEIYNYITKYIKL